jgi:hypothetical protein
MPTINPGFRTIQSSPLSGAHGARGAGFPTDFKPDRVDCGGPTLARGAHSDELMGMHKPAGMLKAIPLNGSIAEGRLALRQHHNVAAA